MTEAKSKAGSLTAARALNVLEILGTKGEMGVRDIARNLDVAPSMAQRMVNTLSSAGFIEKAAESSKWKIGYKTFQIGSAFLSNTDLNAAASLELRLLAEDHEINSFLGVLRDQSVVYLAAVQSGAAITISNSPGSRTYLHSTALGKALLASMTDDQAARLLGAEPYKQLTRKTRKTFASILKDMQECRRIGYAICDEENIENIYAAGAPIRNAGGQTIAALSGAIPRQKLSTKAMTDLGKLVRDAAARASHRLGAPK